MLKKVRHDFPAENWSKYNPKRNFKNCSLKQASSQQAAVVKVVSLLGEVTPEAKVVCTIITLDATYNWARCQNPEDNNQNKVSYCVRLSSRCADYDNDLIAVKHN